jgi:hypothetical protein
MHPKINDIKKLRQYLLRQIETLTSAQLNLIPAGFNNNIIWNLAHLVATQQQLCYGRSGLALPLEERFFSPFMPGAKPEAPMSDEDIALVKASLLDSMDQLAADYNNGLFNGAYTPSVMIPQIYGLEVTTLDAAIDYLVYHEGQHAGYVLALKRLVTL